MIFPGWSQCCDFPVVVCCCWLGDKMSILRVENLLQLNKKFCFMGLSTAESNFTKEAGKQTLSEYVYHYHTVNCKRFCLFGIGRLWLFVKYLRTTEQICTKLIRKTRFVPCLDEFEGRRSRSPGTKTAFFGRFGGLRTVYVY